MGRLVQQQEGSLPAPGPRPDVNSLRDVELIGNDAADPDSRAGQVAAQHRHRLWTAHLSTPAAQDAAIAEILACSPARSGRRSPAASCVTNADGSNRQPHRRRGRNPWDALSSPMLRHVAEVQEATLVVGPMSPAALREAIVTPAAASGLIVERSLTARIVHDVADRPGGLPLMSHALLETWRRRRGCALTEAIYDAAAESTGPLPAPRKMSTPGCQPRRQRLPGESCCDSSHLAKGPRTPAVPPTAAR